MSDLISRQAVLASIKNLYPDMPAIDYLGARRKWLEKYTPYFDCENAVKQLPSVAIKGEWIYLDECANSGYYCSICHKKLVKDGWSDTVKKIKFCPNCGADMRGET